MNHIAMYALGLAIVAVVLAVVAVAIWVYMLENDK